MRIDEACMMIALEAHHGAVNKHDGEPYILHVARVVTGTGAQLARVCALDGFAMTDEYLDLARGVAWLHDTIEDTSLTTNEIWGTLIGQRFNPNDIDEILQGVIDLTKSKGVTNEEYYHNIKGNPISRACKLSDIQDNFSRNHRIEDMETAIRMAKKYSLGLEILGNP